MYDEVTNLSGSIHEKSSRNETNEMEMFILTSNQESIMFEDLNDDNFLIYAMKAYESPNTILSEFEDDLKRIKYVKRLIKKYNATGDLRERLILNHIIVLGNVFGVGPAVRMLFFKLDEEDYHILKTFLLFLNYMPNSIHSINGKELNSQDITVDIYVARKLRENTK